MKRTGRLWPELTSFPHLLRAAEAAAAGKRKRPDVAAFLLNLEPELVRLQRELTTETYKPGRYRTFAILDPKPRHISAAPFRDRVVHHALTSILEPIFEPTFSTHSFACRKGMGTHKALAVAREGANRFPWVLKLDVRKYFASLDHQILNKKLAGRIKCLPTLRLAATIIRASNPQEEVAHYFPGDDLFTPLERRRGLPLGNQTSQFFANVYLDSLDRLLDEKLKPQLWARYVDDLVIFAHHKTQLSEIRHAVESELTSVRLTLNSGKSRIHRCADGVTFLGWQFFPHLVRLVPGNAIRFGRRMKVLRRDFAAQLMEFPEVTQCVRAWIAHASFGDTKVLRERLLARFAFGRGEQPLRAGGRFQQ